MILKNLYVSYNKWVILAIIIPILLHTEPHIPTEHREVQQIVRSDTLGYYTASVPSMKPHWVNEDLTASIN
jgi:hypothetical protein